MNALLVPHESAESLTFMVFIHVGSRYEEKANNGASHFLEHLFFKGTDKHPTTLSLSQELDRYGAEYNAYTSKDLTGFYIKIDATKTTLAIELLHEMLFASKFDPAEIDRERGVIIEEINMYEDNPAALMDDLLEEVSFPKNSLGWTIAGPRENIRAMTREQILAHKDRYYIPPRMTLVAAGKLDKGILALLEKTFGTVTRPKKREDAAFLPFSGSPVRAPRLKFLHKKTEQVQLGLSFPGYHVSDPKTPPARLLGLMLGGSMSSRLFTEVRERRGLCYGIHAGHQALEDTGIFSISAGLETKRFGEAVSVIWDELARMAKDGVEQKELQDAKDHYRGKLTLAFEDSSTQADWYGKQWIFRHDTKPPEAWLQKMERVNPRQILSVAQELFQKKFMRAAVVGPFEEKELKGMF